MLLLATATSIHSTSLYQNAIILLTIDIYCMIIYSLKDLFVLCTLVGSGDEKGENSPDKYPAWGREALNTHREVQYVACQVHTGTLETDKQGNGYV